MNTEKQIKHNHPDAMTTDEATALFAFISFLAPFAYVKRKSDGATGTLEFNHSPRLYFQFIKD
tara:strand:- start:287 stop:475 length:189 start_codon:yes stop_codon:yes gene_type:complete